MSNELEPLLSIRQLAAQFGKSQDAIYRLVRHPDPAKRLPHRVLLNRSIHFLPSEVKAWLDRQAGHRLPPEPEKPEKPQPLVRNSRYRE